MNYFMIFIVYSVIGWLWESIYCSFKARRFVYRGFLLGPYCPVYGFGISFVLLLVPKDAGSLFNLYLNMVVITTVVEYITSWLLEKLFNMKLWDYSTLPFNINGRVAIPVSIFWGFGCLLIIKIVQPILESGIGRFDEWSHGFGPIIIFLIFVADVVATMIFNFTMKNEISEKIVASDDGNADLKQYRLEQLYKNQLEDRNLSIIREHLANQRKSLKRWNMQRIIKNFPNLKLKK
ncbi:MULTISPECIES: hypothetical protein [unclassified Enterococcus]|uniref:putative ABC transporter permease n=1 Tax=unclassified Enterococcus TaxID=2608891 RepID=UPI0024755E8C|nr:MULTISPECIES: hypothetical protein [unclassified Enterococcus]